MDITKFFVSNLPEGCTPWELRRGLEGFGNITGAFVAKKRDKSGSRFGFVSFKDVRDKAELEKLLRGAKLGDSKLKVNIARFALENSGIHAQPVVNSFKPGSSSVNDISKRFNVRYGRSFRDVVGSSSGGGGIHPGSGLLNEGAGVFGDKAVVVPDRLCAFQEWYGKAVVGRTSTRRLLWISIG
ncbi:putative RNA recognition motif domain, nucleotide-binding alpha-beta plait domain superfamily [Helianthus annuus]|nr:putative RNA recognition motif domain, nucleotide-binding alpha-beta plait domain superfamily [Helianthus annuus]